MTIDIPEGYEALGSVLAEAVEQAAGGKGAERHAYSSEPFSGQLIREIPFRLGPGGECFCLGQAVKKIYESRRLPPDRARAELLGAIVYAAAAVPLLRDADAPRFRKGDFVEYRLRDGKWKPSAFAGMDGSFAVVMSGGGKIRIPVCDVRPAESVSAPEDVATPLFAEGERVKYAVDGKWEDGGGGGIAQSEEPWGRRSESGSPLRFQSPGLPEARELFAGAPQRKGTGGMPATGAFDSPRAPAAGEPARMLAGFSALQSCLTHGSAGAFRRAVRGKTGSPPGLLEARGAPRVAGVLFSGYQPERRTSHVQA